MTDKRTILVVEDEIAISNFICRALTVNEYQPITASTAREAGVLFCSEHPDLILLDLGLPDRDGIDLLVELKDLSPNTPIIVVSARDQEGEKVRALDLGADDYITKPFGVSELLARIRATLRHTDRLLLAEDSAKDQYRVGDLLVDIRRHQVFIGDNEIHFTQNEFKIIELLCLHAGRVLTYDAIINHVWGPYGGSSNQILRVHMANIRRKLNENPSQPKYILTVLGIGYRMLEDN
ncbi:MAG: response regulator transcription factor [Oscillospiraceae bacterium]|nr:response regulator transcription factor [Oscillospiraceae bacterium]